MHTQNIALQAYDSKTGRGARWLVPLAGHRRKIGRAFYTELEGKAGSAGGG